MGGRRPGAEGGTGAAASTLEMGRLETPARGKPYIDQHQLRELRRSVAETAGYIQMRSAAGPLRAGTAAFEPLQRRSAVFHRPDIVESFKCTAG